MLRATKTHGQAASAALLVGLDAPDDAAVVRLSDTEAHVATVDFFGPVVDDPATFGAIAAANALSDLYAMGATPRFALNIVGFPIRTLPLAMLEEILAGGARKAAEAGIPIVGGQSIETTEPVYGLSAHGVVHPDRIYRKSGARRGDRLILTKPLGVGAITVALRKDMASSSEIEAACASMLQLNAAAAAELVFEEVNAVTDVTGFGLLGHLRELLRASHATAVLHLSKILWLPGAERLASLGIFPRATKANAEDVQPDVGFEPEISEAYRLLLADPQTSGGLLIACRPEAADGLLQRLQSRGLLAAEIGEVTAEGARGIQVRAQ